MPASPTAVSLLKRLVPRPVKTAVRRAYERRTLDDAIAHVVRLPQGHIPSRSLLDDLQVGWANHGMAARTDYLEEVCRQALVTNAPILECGSGLTTILLGILAGRRGVDTWTLEHMPEWHRVVASALSRSHISRVRLLLTPLRSFGAFSWYDAPLETLPAQLGLVVCDGPPSETPGGRYGMLPRLQERLAPQAIVLLDDAERTSESNVLARWQREHGIRASTRETPSGTYAVAVVHR